MPSLCFQWHSHQCVRKFTVVSVDILLQYNIKLFMNKIVAAFRGIHMLPAKHSYAWLPRKCNYQYRQTHARTKWSLCAAMLRGWHKNNKYPTKGIKNTTCTLFEFLSITLPQVQPVWAFLCLCLYLSLFLPSSYRPLLKLSTYDLISHKGELTGRSNYFYIHENNSLKYHHTQFCILI